MVKAETVIRSALAVTLVVVFGIVGLLFWVYVVVRNPIHAFRNLFSPKKRSEIATFLNNPEFGTHDFVRVGRNVKLHYVTKGTGPLVLFVHGFPQFWYTWVPQMKELSKTHRCVAVDMRGYGDSDRPSAVADYDREILVDDLKDLILALGEKSAIVVAHDWGGIVAWDLVSKYPNMVSKYVVMNAPHPAMYELRMRGAQIIKSLYIFFFCVPYLPELLFRTTDFAVLQRIIGSNGKFPSFTKQDVEVYKYAALRPGALTAMLNYYRAMMPSLMGTRRPPKYAKTKVTVPTLILWGLNDIALHPSLNDGVERYVENVKIVELPLASHWVNHDRVQVVNGEIAAFIDA